MEIKEHLNNLTLNNYRSAFKAIHYTKPPSRKMDIINTIVRMLHEEPMRLISAMSEAEQLMLAAAVHENTTIVSPERLKARYGLEFSFNRYSSYGAPFQISRLLVYYDYGEHQLINGVADILKANLPKPPPLEVKTSHPNQDEFECFAHESGALTELKRMLQLVSAGKLKVSDKTGLPGKSTMNAVRKVLTDDEPLFGPERSFIWPLLLQQCKWAKARNGLLKLTPAGTKLLSNFSPQAFADGVYALISDSTFDEIFRVSEIKGYKGKSARRHWIKAKDRRLGIFEALEDFPANEWVHIKNAYDFLVANGGDCRVVTEGYALYLYDREYGALSGNEMEIGKVYFRQFICESLATLGLIDLLHRESEHGYYKVDLTHCWGMDSVTRLTRYDGIEYIRLTPLGHFCFSDDVTEYDAPLPEKQALFNVLPNLDIVVLNPTAFSAGDEALLERVAKKHSDAVWKLDRHNVLQALGNGDSKADILAVLENGSANEIPSQVHQLIKDTVKRSEAVISREEATAVTLIDEETAALIQNDRAIAATLLGRNGSTLFVRTRNLNKFQSKLRIMGILLP